MVGLLGGASLRLEDICMICYLATILRVIDGDTVDAQVDLGFGVYIKRHIRLAGINTAKADTEVGIDATHYLTSKVLNRTVTLGVDAHRATEKYGRILGTLIVDGVNINADLVQLGFAVPYDGSTPHQRTSPIPKT
jgi:micrococcal nuclease